MGIVNAGMLEVYEEIEPELKVLVEDVLLNRRPDATERLVDFGEGPARTGHFGRKYHVTKYQHEDGHQDEQRHARPRGEQPAPDQAPGLTRI